MADVDNDLDIVVIHETDLGPTIGLGDDKKLTIITNNNGNVKFTKTNDGLKGDVDIPPQKTSLSDVSIAGNTLTFPTTDGGERTVDLPAIPVDVTVDNISFTDDGLLKVVLTNGVEKTTQFDAKVIIAAIIAAPEEERNKLKTFIIDLIKGKPIKRLSGDVDGYAITTA